jgi:hypothetical protein
MSLLSQRERVRVRENSPQINTDEKDFLIITSPV